jgi:hypothetical protein
MHERPCRFVSLYMWLSRIMRCCLRARGAARGPRLDVRELLRHLRVTEVLVEHEAVHEPRVLRLGADLAVELDEVEVDVLALEVRDREHRFDAHRRHLALAAADDLRGERRHARRDEGARVVDGELERLRDRAEALDAHCACHLVALRAVVGDTRAEYPSTVLRWHIYSVASWRGSFAVSRNCAAHCRAARTANSVGRLICNSRHTPLQFAKDVCPCPAGPLLLLAAPPLTPRRLSCRPRSRRLGTATS